MAASRSRTPSSSSNRRPWVEAMLRSEPGPSAAVPRSGMSRASSDRPGPMIASSSAGVGAPHEAAKGLDHGRVRQGALTDRDAAADEDRHARRAGRFRDLGHEPRLADPGLARDEQRAAATIARIIERGAHPFDLLRPADQDRARDTDCHAFDYQANHRRASSSGTNVR